MVANKQALPFLPAGADINALTYDAAPAMGQGHRRQDRPAPPRLSGRPDGADAALLPGLFLSLLHRRRGRRPFKSPDAEAGWDALKDLWAAVNPNSTNYNFMQEPLLAGEVWIAWDHIARAEGRADAAARPVRRLPGAGRPEGPRLHAGDRRPRHPEGRARTAPARVAVIEHLTQARRRSSKTAAEVGFFPVVKAELPAGSAAGIKLLAERGRDDAERQGRAASRCCPSASAPRAASSTRSIWTPSSASCCATSRSKAVLEAQAEALDAHHGRDRRAVLGCRTSRARAPARSSDLIRQAARGRARRARPSRLEPP